MDRRRLLLAASALFSAPLLHAQGARPRHLVGWLSPTNREDQGLVLAAFNAKLRELGQVEGRDYAIEFRYADGRPERLPALARELVALKPAIITTASSAAVAALQKATTSVPVVFATAASPVEQGFIKSLARPGGNITGVTLRGELNLKVVQIAHEALPAMRRVAVLVHASDPVSARVVEQFQRGAADLKLELQIIRVTQAEEFQRAAGEALQHKADALVAPALAMFIQHAQKLCDAATKARLPLIGSFRAAARRGGLLSHYIDTTESFRRAAVLVDKILKGAKPAELAVEQPDRFLTAINLRTAKALGIKIPQQIMLRADEVIE